MAQDAIALARASVEAFSAGDWGWLRAHSAPDMLYEETGTGQRIQGADAVLAYVQAWKQAMPDAKGTITGAIGSGDQVALEIVWDGHQTGPLPTPIGVLPPSGKRAASQAVQIITLEGDKVKRVRHYLDLLGFLQQVGALPEASQARAPA